jgi:hypothetical protein
MARPLSTPGKDPVPIVQEAGWAPETVWTNAENLATTGIRSPDRPARSQSLYRLSYQAHLSKELQVKVQHSVDGKSETYIVKMVNNMIRPVHFGADHKDQRTKYDL